MQQLYRAKRTLGKDYSKKVLNVVPSNLIGYWPLDEPNGAVAYNLASKGGLPAAVGDGVVNGEFTSNTTGWTTNNCVASVVDSGAEPGAASGGGDNACLKLVDGGSAARVSQVLSVVPGQIYTVSVRAYAPSSNTASKAAALNVGASIPISTEDSWEEITTTFTPTASSHSIFLEVYAGSNNDVAYFDKVVVTGPIPHASHTGVTLQQPGIGDGRASPYYDGTNDYTNLYSAALAGAFNGAEGTLMAWAKVSGAGVWTDNIARYIAKLNVDANNYIWLYKETNNAVYGVYKAGGTTESANYSLGGALGWFCLAITWSASTGADGEVKYYKAGALLETDTALGTWAGSLLSSTTTIGAGATTPSAVWDGTLAHVALWNTPLTAAQIAYLSRVK